MAGREPPSTQADLSSLAEELAVGRLICAAARSRRVDPVRFALGLLSTPSPPIGQPLSTPPPPRARAVLQRLLSGESEKQAAAALHLSRHTVHQHVKRLYIRYAVHSRSELMALLARPRRLTTRP